MTRGIYTLILHLPRSQEIAVGALGPLQFLEGYYAYTGSARSSSGFRRVDRHMQVMRGERKTRRWHIDYLLPLATLVETATTTTGEDLECKVARSIACQTKAVPGFGCSDCRCPSHLHYWPKLDHLREAVHRAHQDAECSL